MLEEMPAYCRMKIGYQRTNILDVACEDLVHDRAALNHAQQSDPRRAGQPPRHYTIRTRRN